MLESFHHLRSVLCSVSVLNVPTPDDVFTVETDASAGGVGGVLNVVRPSLSHFSLSSFREQKGNTLPRSWRPRQCSEQLISLLTSFMVGNIYRSPSTGIYAHWKSYE